MENESKSDPICPTSCPNRASDGVYLFGVRIAPIEIVLQISVLLLVLIPAARQSAQDSFTPFQALQWISTAAGGIAIIRVSPTDRINASLKLLGK